MFEVLLILGKSSISIWCFWRIFMIAGYLSSFFSLTRRIFILLNFPFICMLISWSDKIHNKNLIWYFFWYTELNMIYYWHFFLNKKKTIGFFFVKNYYCSWQAIFFMFEVDHFSNRLSWIGLCKAWVRPTLKCWACDLS